jgi:hypothetical protein
MEKQKLSPKSIINIIRAITAIFILLICILSPLAFFLAYFMLKDSVNATTEFFLRWTCVSILTVTIGLLFQFFSALMGANHFPGKKCTLVILVGAIGQSLIMTYLFATYQPGPDQMSRIYMLSWILFATATSMFCITTCKPSSEDLDADNQPCNFPRLITIISIFSTIGLWITIAILSGSQ